MRQILYNDWRKQNIVDYLWIFLVVILLRSDPSSNKVILHGVGKSVVVVTRCRHVTILDERVMQMTTEGFLHLK